MSAWPYTPKIPPMALYVFTPRRQPSNPTTPGDSPKGNAETWLATASAQD